MCSAIHSWELQLQLSSSTFAPSVAGQIVVCLEHDRHTLLKDFANYMTPGTRVPGCTSRPIRSQTAILVRISDRLVASTFSQVSQQRRHGSCVPGPLEARRRASRRRNASLAYPSWGDMFIDPADVLGRAVRPGWWQSVVQRRVDQSEFCNCASQTGHMLTDGRCQRTALGAA